MKTRRPLRRKVLITCVTLSVLTLIGVGLHHSPLVVAIAPLVVGWLIILAVVALQEISRHP